MQIYIAMCVNMQLIILICTCVGRGEYYNIDGKYYKFRSCTLFYRVTTNHIIKYGGT